MIMKKTEPEALLLLEDRKDQREIQLKKLRAKLQAGADSGPGILSEKVFARLEAKYRRQTPGD